MKTIYRNRKLLDLAHRVKQCTFRLNGCTRYSPDGCEPCHSNQSKHGKATSMKSADDQHAAGCHWCHMIYDGHAGIVLPREEAVAVFNRARKETFELYEKEGWLDEVGYLIEEGALNG